MASEIDPSPERRQRRKMQRVTMSEVAEMAQVSPSTVSLYLRKPQAVSAKAGREIARAIDRLGYVPNLVAGGLAAASSPVVSIIIPSLRNAFFAETVSVLHSELLAHNLQLLVAHNEYSAKQEETLVRTAMAWAPAAIVLTGLAHSRSTRDLLRIAGVPVVEMWELGDQPIDMMVGFSHQEVGATAARHLLKRDYSTMAFLGARLQEDRRAAQRAEGFAATLAEAGHGACAIINHPAPATTEAGALLLSRALSQVPNLRAVCCSNDHVALGVLFECQRRGISVPDDLAVIGFGDLGFAASCIPSLTTIRPSGDIIGKEVARLILERVGNDHMLLDDGPGAIVDTGHVLIERGST